MVLYHGTHVQNIKILKPFATRGNAISKPVICFTPNFCMALLYIWNRSYKWVTFNENRDGRIVFTEHYDNMLYDFYNQVSGSIYECDGNNADIQPTHMKGVFVSEKTIGVEKEIIVPSVYDEVIKQESLGNVVVRIYNQLPSEEKNEISKTTVRAIHMQKLLTPSDFAPKKELAAFVRSHFSTEWETASKMTEEEIEQMINEWRASLE